MKAFKSLSFYIVIIAAILIAVVVISSYAGAEEMHYSELISQIQAGNVKSIVLSSDTATVKLKADTVSIRENDKGEEKEHKLKASDTFEVKIIAADEFQNYVTSVLEADTDGEAPFRYTNKIKSIPFWYAFYLIFFHWRL